MNRLGQPGAGKTVHRQVLDGDPWFTRISAVDSWWWKSRRASATFAWAWATFTRAFSPFFEPFCLRDSAR